jgi:Uma2 family endonuclease
MLREATQPYVLMTAQEFLAWDDDSDTRYELVDGLLYAQAATTLSHAEMLLRLGSRLMSAAESAGCSASSGAGIQVAESTVYIPDIVVACDRSSDQERSIARPTIIAEIASPSTARIDRNEKRHAYLAIDSLRSYLMVYPDARRIEHYWRDDPSSSWRSMTHTGGSVPLPELNTALLLDDIYRGLDASVDE